MSMPLYIAKNNAWTRRGRPSISDDAFVAGWGFPAFRDEFTSAGTPDPVKWNVRDRSTFGLLNDATIIKSSQCVVNGSGRLEIRGEWMDEVDWENTATGPQGNPTFRGMRTGYIEHRLSSGTIYEQRYGMWQYKVKVPMAPDVSLGTLGAVWLRNSKTGEIDMTEGWGSGPSAATARAGWYPAQPKPNAGRTTFTIHSNTSGGGTKEAWTQPSPVYDGWVEYRFIYTEDRFEFYRKREGLDADWVAQFLITPTSHWALPGTLSGPTPPSQTHFAKFWTDTSAYDAPWHLRMNLHIGPSIDFYGVPDPDHPEWTDDPVMEVEYVRIYALP